MLLEAQFPVLKDEDPTVIYDAGSLTREAGAVTPVEGSDTSDNSDMRGAADKVLTFGLASEVAKKLGREPRPNLAPEPAKK